MGQVVGWRVVKQKHASTAFSGEGARLFEGRWNSAGIRMVYCSEHLSLAALEILVHTQPVILHDKFRAFRVVWDDRLMTSLDEAKLPRGWNAPMATAASRQIGDGWIQDGKSVILAVPSVIVPQERTFLINPRHSDFRRIKIADTGRFTLDPRLR